MRAPFVAPIENLLHLQVDLLCKSTLLAAHSEQEQEREHKDMRVVALRWLLLIKSACGFHSAPAAVAAAAIFQSALSFQCPLTISIWRQLPAILLISLASRSRSEPQLLTKWHLDLIWNVQITNIIKDEQR